MRLMPYLDFLTFTAHLTANTKTGVLILMVYTDGSSAWGRDHWGLFGALD